MTNFEKWLKYTEGLPSPDNYISWGYRYLIAAALQRRVWMPPKHRPCYPNLYPILVGKPGIGKGQVIKTVEEILRYHKLEVDGSVVKNASTLAEKEIAQTAARQDLEEAQKNDATSNSNVADKPLLIPIAANATTYEALVQHMSRCLRRINYKLLNEKTGQYEMKIHSHSSLCFCLEEIASLFRKHHEDVINFLLEAYDCNENYEYRTKTQGKDRIRRVCLNMFGGTTPDFMRKTFDDGLLNQGFSSRAFFIYAAKNRKTVFFIPELSTNQSEYKQAIIDHVKGLTELYGQVILKPDTIKFLEDWWVNYENSVNNRASQSRKLDAYYSRKNIHVMKTAMAIHFGETYDMTIPVERFQEAIALLHEEEKTMHLALAIESENPLATATQQIVDYLSAAGPKTSSDLLLEFWGKVRDSELQEILNFLQSSHQVTTIQKEDEHTNEVHIYYKVK